MHFMTEAGQGTGCDARVEASSRRHLCNRDLTDQVDLKLLAQSLQRQVCCGFHAHIIACMRARPCTLSTVISMFSHGTLILASQESPGDAVNLMSLTVTIMPPDVLAGGHVMLKRLE